MSRGKEKIPNIYEIKRKVNRGLIFVIVIASILVVTPESLILVRTKQTGRNEFLLGAVADFVAIVGLGLVATIYSHTLLKMYERIDAALVRLQKTELYKSAIMSSALDAILSVDNEGFVFECSPVAEKIFRMKVKEVLGKPLSELFRWPSEGELSSSHLVQKFVKNIKPQSDVRLEIIGRRADGKEFPAEIALAEVRIEESSFFTIFVRDITERRRADDAKTRAIRARDEMLAVVSHEMKNPLTAIGTSLAMMRRAATPLFEENLRLQKYYDNIDMSVRRMSRLVSDLLDASRIEAGQLKLELHAISIGELIKEVVQAFLPAAEQKQIHLEQFVSSDSLRVICDRGRIFQVFSNLIGNALKFTGSGGKVLVKAEVKGRLIQFQVRDNGPGIADEHLSNIFNRYWQERRFAAQGIGLGLSIAKGIVDAHHGKIWVESKLSEGSIFYFTLPLISTSAGTTEAVA